MILRDGPLGVLRALTGYEAYSDERRDACRTDGPSHDSGDSGHAPDHHVGAHRYKCMLEQSAGLLREHVRQCGLRRFAV